MITARASTHWHDQAAASGVDLRMSIGMQIYVQYLSLQIKVVPGQPGAEVSGVKNL